MAKEKGVDFILVVGGGSVIDCCKIIAAQVLNKTAVQSLPMRKKELRQVCLVRMLLLRYLILS